MDEQYITKQLHMHVWTEGSDDPEELDLDHVDTYANMSAPDYNDGYLQFGAHDAAGHWIELRIPFDMLEELIVERDRTQAIWDNQHSQEENSND